MDEIGPQLDNQCGGSGNLSNSLRLFFPHFYVNLSAGTGILIFPGFLLPSVVIRAFTYSVNFGVKPLKVSPIAVFFAPALSWKL